MYTFKHTHAVPVATATANPGNATHQKVDILRECKAISHQII